MAKEKIWTEVVITAIPDQFIAHGTPQQLHADLNLDTEGIRKTILQNYNTENSAG